LDLEGTEVVELAALCDLERVVCAIRERGGWGPDELASSRRRGESAHSLEVAGEALAEDDSDWAAGVIRGVGDGLRLAISDWVWDVCERQNSGLRSGQSGQAADDKCLGEHIDLLRVRW